MLIWTRDLAYATSRNDWRHLTFESARPADISLHEHLASVWRSVTDIKLIRHWKLYYSRLQQNIFLILIFFFDYMYGIMGLTIASLTF